MWLIVIIIAIIAFYTSYTKVQNQIGGGLDINSLVYSQREHSPHIKNRVIKTFSLPLPLDTFPRPDTNDSQKVLKELTYLAQLTRDPNPDKLKLANRIEKEGVLKYFLWFAGSKGLVYDEGHLTQVAKDTETLAYLMKSNYNRPRPYQLGFLLGKHVNPIRNARTSSYPCEHTLCAKVLAYQLSYNNPKYKDLLHAIAKKIELSRYYGGMNFPSDTIAALRLADILRNKIKYLETV